MAYNTKYYYRFASCNGKTVEIDVKQNGYSGSATLRRVGGAPVLRMEANDCIHGMSLELPAECIVEDEYADLYSTDPYLFQVDVLVNNSSVWKGYITPELYSAPWIDPPYDVIVTATDGLGELKLHNFPTMGRVTLYSVLSTLLGYTGLSFPINFINTATRSATTASTLLTSTSVNLDHMAGSSCYEVLQAILTSLHATIQQVDGSWLIIRETDVNDRSYSTYVRDTSGNSYGIVDITSMADSDCWPVGQLRMEIQPAKNRVGVTCENHPHQNYLDDPNMVTGIGWSEIGGASHHSTDGGYFEIPTGISNQISQMVNLPATMSGGSDGNTADLVLTVRARQTDMWDAHDIKIGIEAFGTKLGTNTQGHYWYTNDTLRGVPQWKEAEDNKYFYYTTELGAASSGNSADCTTVTVDIPLTALIKTILALGSSSQLRISFRADDSIVCVHSATLAAKVAYEGMSTTLVLNNSARGIFGDITSSFADSYSQNYGKGFIDNTCTPTPGGNWSSAAMPALPYGEFIAKDYAFSCAMPRLRLQGKLNVETNWLPLFLRTNNMMFQTEEWSFDMLNDEVDVSMLSLPAASLQVTSVTTTPLGAADAVSDMSTAVAPTSFYVTADDTSEHYISISQVNTTLWSVSGYDSSWITFSRTSGSGTATIYFTLSENSGAARSSSFTIAGMPVQINQETGVFAFSPTSANVSEDNGSVAVTLTCGASQQWTISSNSTWCTVNGSQSYTGTGPATVHASYGVNIKSTARTAILTVYRDSTAAGTITLTQAGAGSVSITSSLIVGPVGNVYTISVTDSDNIGWRLTSNQSWCTVSPSSGTGTATNITVTIGSNTSTTASRTATITCTPTTGSASTCYVYQSTATAVSISPTSVTFDPAGSTVYLTITGTFTEWEIQPSPTWCIHTGDGGNTSTIELQAPANTGSSQRTGSFIIDVDGTDFTITASQQAQSATTYTFTIVPTPSNATVTINSVQRTSYSCPAGTSITWQVAATGYVSQSGVYTMGAANHTENVTLTQEQTYTLSVSPSSVSFAYDTYSSAFDDNIGESIHIDGNDTWSLTMPSWCRSYYNTTSGTAPQYIKISPNSPNTSSTTRTGTITITGTHGATATVNVTQAALSYEIVGEPYPSIGETFGYITDPVVSVNWSVVTGASICTTSLSDGTFYVTPNENAQVDDTILIRATSTLDNTRYEDLELTVTEAVVGGYFDMPSTAVFTSMGIGNKYIECVPVDIDTSTITVTKSDPDNVILFAQFYPASERIGFSFVSNASSSVDHSWSFTITGTDTGGHTVSATVQCSYTTG